MPVMAEVFGNIGITKDDVDFICSGSTDYLIGGPFSFVMALDAVGVWPPRSESHVEMDGAWALYEAWVLLQEGEIDAALVYAFGRSSLGNLGGDPGPAARPLLPGPAVARPGQPGRPAGPGPHRRRQGPPRRTSPPSPPAAARTPWATPRPRWPTTSRPTPCWRTSTWSRRCAATPCRPSPTARRPSCWPPGTRPSSWSEQPGVDHRLRPPDGDPLARGPGPHRRRRPRPRPPRWPGWPTGRSTWPRSTPPSPTRRSSCGGALGLDDSVVINPSGGPLAANPLMSAGLIRIGEAAERIRSGGARRAVAHATSGPCLQQNLVCVLEGE